VIRHLWGATRVAGWLAWTNVRERMPQRRAEDGRSWWHTVVVVVAWLSILWMAGLLVRCAEMQFSEYRATTTALDKAICERNALLSGESADCGVAK
jgi:hypothetical protein